MTAQRYSIEGTGEGVVMAPYRFGDYVRYIDHAAAVEDARDQALAELTDMTRWIRGRALFFGRGDVDRLSWLIARNERDRIRQAVGALFPQERYPDEHAALMAAIDGGAR